MGKEGAKPAAAAETPTTTTATKFPEYVPNEGLSPLEWLSITENSGRDESYYDVRRRETFIERLFKNPIIPLGFGLGMFAILRGSYNVGKNVQLSNKLLRLRVGSSALVFAAVVWSIRDNINWDSGLMYYYYHKRNAVKTLLGINEEGNDPVLITELSPELKNKIKDKP
ncbi:uncharacterized protein LOC141851984 [Brevipalpus obovatus]|uniref:uncharacterized protein LOC141851984 n=1 Tax=Brevipalpus obovatus TaxID=246614 RepID=UPI003D9E86DB